MAKSRLTHEWNQTADLMALLANINSSRHKRFSRSHFHPMMEYQRVGTKLSKETLHHRGKHTPDDSPGMAASKYNFFDRMQVIRFVDEKERQSMNRIGARSRRLHSGRCVQTSPTKRG